MRREAPFSSTMTKCDSVLLLGTEEAVHQQLDRFGHEPTPGVLVGVQLVDSSNASQCDTGGETDAAGNLALRGLVSA